MWVYDLRTTIHLTLKTKRMARVDLDEVVACHKVSLISSGSATRAWKTRPIFPSRTCWLIAALSGFSNQVHQYFGYLPTLTALL